MSRHSTHDAFSIVSHRPGRTFLVYYGRAKEESFVLLLWFFVRWEHGHRVLVVVDWNIRITSLLNNIWCQVDALFTFNQITSILRDGRNGLCHIKRWMRVIVLFLRREWAVRHELLIFNIFHDFESSKVDLLLWRLVFNENIAFTFIRVEESIFKVWIKRHIILVFTSSGSSKRHETRSGPRTCSISSNRLVWSMPRHTISIKNLSRVGAWSRLWEISKPISPRSCARQRWISIFYNLSLSRLTIFKRRVTSYLFI